LIPDSVLPNRSYLPEGLIAGTISQRVDLSTAAANFPLTEKLPKGAWVEAIAVKVPATITADTAVKIGLGRLTASADPDKYWISAALTAATYEGKALTSASVTAEEELAIFACATGGAAAGTIGATGQYVDVRIMYLQSAPISP
jgi:hypothetical protein